MPPAARTCTLRFVNTSNVTHETSAIHFTVDDEPNPPQDGGSHALAINDGTILDPNSAEFGPPVFDTMNIDTTDNTLVVDDK
jgi:hypothetical protein